MEQVERPEVDGASSQVGAAWRLGNDFGPAYAGPHFWHGMFYHVLFRITPLACFQADLNSRLISIRARV
jgi:hypothetical protein